ncbi:hypothetical protein FH972_021238 [Carpinus fangiana]|uniref:HMG box domain-containing protein n=1 Tax=Carpinus fangiana TaxID=176857 RepID=A0A5N6KP50_9ROSI|nr:hypothetical protein FH972_021238 [Carpinus fangiana]
MTPHRTDLGVKLGHRRRAIAESRQQSIEASPLPGDKTILGDTAGNNAPGSSREQPPGRTKRKYKRHPKVVGERWQVLATDEREGYETHASNAKEKYMNAMAEYKKTDDYAQYQQYLADFKARHSHQQPEQTSGAKKELPPVSQARLTGAADAPKRAKLETETSTETQSSLDDHTAAQRRLSAPQNHNPPPTFNTYHHDHYSKSTSPATTHYSPMPSPARHSGADGYAAQISPTSSAGRHGPFELPPYPSAIGPPDRRLASLHDIDPGGRRRTPLLSQNSSGSNTTLPPLTKELSTLSSRSSDSPHSPAGNPFQTMMKDGMPPSSRILPAPISTGVPHSGKTLEHRPLASPPSAYTPPDDPRHSSSLAALLRAGELASEADRRQQEAPNAPRPAIERAQHLCTHLRTYERGHICTIYVGSSSPTALFLPTQLSICKRGPMSDMTMKPDQECKNPNSVRTKPYSISITRYQRDAWHRFSC